MLGELRQRLQLWGRIVWHGGLSLIALITGGVMVTALFIRDEVMPSEWAEELYLSNLPTPSTWQWVAIIETLAVLFVLEGAYRLFTAAGLSLEPAPAAIPRARLGKLDYLPELLAAADEYLRAQAVITSAMNAATPVITQKNQEMHVETQPDRKRAIGSDIASQFDNVTYAIKANLPAMNEKADVVREASLGVVKIAAIHTDQDMDQFREFAEILRTARQSVHGQLTSLKALRQTAREQLRENISIALNEAILELLHTSNDYHKTITRLEGNFGRLLRAALRKKRLAAIRLSIVQRLRGA